jgi:hypothetical protein
VRIKPLLHSDERNEGRDSMGKLGSRKLPKTYRVRIPFLNKIEDHAPVQEALVRSAESAGITPLQMALYANHFLEQVAEQMIDGCVVRIPGFGVFGPKTRFRKVNSKYFGNLSSAYPAFVGSPRLKLEIKMRVRPALNPETDPMRALAKNNSYRKRLGTKSLPESFRNIRRGIMDCNARTAKMLGQKIY